MILILKNWINIFTVDEIIQTIPPLKVGKSGGEDNECRNVYIM
jgi:hypothetical protein